MSVRCSQVPVQDLCGTSVNCCLALSTEVGRVACVGSFPVPHGQPLRAATAAASQWVVKAVKCPTQADHSWAVSVASSAGVVGHAGVGLNEADTARMLVGGQHLRLLSDFRLSAPGFSSFLHGPAGAGVWTCLVVVVA